MEAVLTGRRLRRAILAVLLLLLLLLLLLRLRVLSHRAIVFLMITVNNDQAHR